MTYKGFVIGCVVLLLVFAGGLFVGAKYLAPALTQHHYHETQTVIEKPAEVKETVTHEVQTVTQYVPKETIKYVDKATGKEVTGQEQTDVEANLAQPGVTVKVNGQPYQFSLLQGENQKFENGKVVMNQSSNVGIDLQIKPQVVDNTKNGGIDLILGKYSGFGIKQNRVGVDVTRNIHDKHDTMYQGRWTAIQW